MKKFLIIPDTGCDLTKDLREQFGIDDYVSGTLIYPDGHSEPITLDWETTTPEEFFKTIGEKKQTFTTAQPNHESIRSVFEPYCAQGYDILGISISTGISGAYDSFCTVASELTAKYPDIKIRCVDSKRFSGGEALLCKRAGELRSQGFTLDETADALEIEKNTIHESGLLDDLFFCKRMGRVSNAAAVMGTLVGIKPMADFDAKGLSHVIGKAKGYNGALRTGIEYIKETILHPENQTIMVIHSARQELAEKYKAMIDEQIKPAETIIASVGQSCGPNIGPGLIAAFYFGKEISADSSEETAAFERASQRK